MRLIARRGGVADRDVFATLEGQVGWGQQGCKHGMGLRTESGEWAEMGGDRLAEVVELEGLNIVAPEQDLRSFASYKCDTNFTIMIFTEPSELTMTWIERSAITKVKRAKQTYSQLLRYNVSAPGYFKDPVK